MPTPTRADDERLLAVLKLRGLGLSHREIAASLGMTRRQVGQQIENVRVQDCKYDPEAAPYWSSRHDT